MYLPFCPVDVRVLNAADALPALRERLSPSEKILLLASRSRYAALGLEAFVAALREDGHTVTHYPEITPNPTIDDVVALLDFLRRRAFAPTTILAIGGGSCIDLGKAAGALYPLLPVPTADAVRKALQTRAYAQPHDRAAVFAMPTTAGTGSEVTPWATLWDPQEGRKLSLDDTGGFPKAALIVPEWTCGLPVEITLSTGLDALSHAMEAFWAVRREPLSQELALAAAVKVRDALPAALQNPLDLDARREMALGSLLAGLAFSRTRTTACHSISYPLTLLFGIPHGFAVALTLSSVLKRNEAAVPEITRLTAVFSGQGGFENWLTRVSRSVQPLRLSAFGLTDTDLPAVRDRAFTPGHMDNNPVPFTPDEVLAILRENL
ncbi:MAG: phosphonoacetaldehyde reductase [Eubacteriales bacterium]|nr:phosphonoacetaldehyde reductase [Eubacteriales bacterium]